MSKIKLVVLAIILVIIVLAASSIIFSKPKVEADDYFVEDIGGDGFLVANVSHSLKISEENIPDGTFRASMGDYNYYNAKNISYLGFSGSDYYMIVWKTTPEKYNCFNTSDNVNQYISDYSADDNLTGFIEYSYENNAVYGIIIWNEYGPIWESTLMYNILDLNEKDYSLVYSNHASSGGYSSSDHYHTVVPDRYSLSRSDPGAYYDHYEYGDDYAIDDYLESQGFD